MKFTGPPIKLKVSQGQPVKLNCSLEGMEDPEMLWIKDGAVVQSVDQVYIPVDEEHWIGFLRYNRCREGRISWKLLQFSAVSYISATAVPSVGQGPVVCSSLCGKSITESRTEATER